MTGLFNAKNIEQLNLDPAWKEVLKEELCSENFSRILSFLEKEKKEGKTVYPPFHQIFSAFNATLPDSVRVVIIGQDPYHGTGQAHGLCFSVNHGVEPPPSLVNIFKELHSDLGIAPSAHGNLSYWAAQGVLLLNAILTVRADEAGSHANIGWEQFTDSTIRYISQSHIGVVFMLWGKFAHSKQTLIDKDKHFILKAAHPSPLSAHNGFFGCRHFSTCNEILRSIGYEVIDWKLPE